MKPLRFTGLAALAASLAACVPSSRAPLPQPAPTTSTRPVPAATTAPVAPLATRWEDLPITPGTWTLAETTGAVTASYGAPGSEARLVLRCDRTSRQVSVERAGTTPRLVIRSETRNATLPARPGAGGLPTSIATVPGSDPILDAMALSRGRFAVESPGLSTLVLPAWAEVSVVVEACR